MQPRRIIAVYKRAYRAHTRVMTRARDRAVSRVLYDTTPNLAVLNNNGCNDRRAPR